MPDGRDLETSTASAATAEARPVQPEASGPGVKAIEALVAKGQPGPADVVKVLDAHRAEHDAIMAVLHRSFGNAYVGQVMEAMDHLRLDVHRRELVDGDPSNPDSGYFIASEADKGARWRTADGSFTGSADGKGLRSRYAVDGDTALLGNVDARSRTATLGLEDHGKVMGEAYGRYGGAEDWSAGVRATRAVGDGATLTPELRHVVGAGGARDEVAGAYRSRATDADAVLGHGDHGFSESLSATHRFDDRTSASAALAHGPDGTTGSLSGTHRFDDRTSVAGTVGAGPAGPSASLSGTYRAAEGRTVTGSLATGPDETRLGVDGAYRVDDHLSLTGSAAHTHSHRTGGDQSTLSIGERYRSPDVIHGLDLHAGSGTRDYVGMTGSADIALGPNLFAGGFGEFASESGHHSTATFGGSLTFTSSEKTALTLAGLVDQEGRMETRLQFDLFKQRIDNLSSFADHKKDAMLSLFLSYTTGGGPRQLDDRFGGPQLETNKNGDQQVTAGIRIRF